MRVQDRVVWITGASSGIGEAFARICVEAGAKVIASARRVEKLQALRDACTAPERMAVLPLDVGELDVLPAKADAAAAFFGPVDMLVNNAGIGQRGTVVDCPVAVDQRILHVNLLGTIALTKAVLPAMVERRDGQIVTVSSILGKFGAPTRSAYCASKHGLHGFFDSLRAEVHQHNIRITLVCPGFVRTEVSIHALGPDGTEHGELDPGQQKGMAPDVFARKMLAAVEKEKAEVYIGGHECLGVTAKRFMPRLFDWIIRRVNVDG